MKSLNDYMKNAQTELFNETGTFFAFSQKQFNDAKKEGEKYCSMGLGMYTPTKNAKRVNDGLTKIYEQGISQDLEENGKLKIIKRELANYECYYMGYIDESVFDSLKDYGISKNEIRCVFRYGSLTQ